VLHVYKNIKKRFTITQFNDRVRWITSIAEVDKGNTPAELNPIKEQDKGLSPKLTGNEMMALSSLVARHSSITSDESHLHFFNWGKSILID
jgi:hypothetical protein